MYIVAVLRDRLYCRVERSVLTVINEYVMLCYGCVVLTPGCLEDRQSDTTDCKATSLPVVVIISIILVLFL